MTTSHLRFGPRPIRSTYLIGRAGQLRRLPPVPLPRADGRPRGGGAGRDVPVEQPVRAGRPCGTHLPVETQRQIVEKGLRFYVVDAQKVATAAGLGCRDQHDPADVLLRPGRACSTRRGRRRGSRPAIEKSYGKRGALRRGAELRRGGRRARRACTRFPCRPAWPAICTGCRRCREEAPDFVQRVTAMMLAGKGDLLPVSAPAGRRDVPDRHGAVGEALDRAGDPDLGPGHLHRLRQVRAWSARTRRSA